jgi:hypothetical protein
MMSEKGVWLAVLVVSLLFILIIVGAATNCFGLANKQLLYAHGYCVYQDNVPLYLVPDYSIDEYGNLVLERFQPIGNNNRLLSPDIVQPIKTVIIRGNWRIEYYNNEQLSNVFRIKHYD